MPGPELRTRPPRPAADDDDDLDFEDDVVDTDSLYLPKHTAQQVPLKLLRTWYVGENLNLNPYYQREVVWNVQRQSKVINSFFTNYYVPPVILKADLVVKHGKQVKVYTCVDGKQRISSILNFFDCKIPYIDPNGQRWWYPVVGGEKKTGRWLTPELVYEFHRHSILVVEYAELSTRQEEELFARVQQGMALSAAEKTQAGQGPWHRLVRTIMRYYPRATGLCADNTRGKEFGRVSATLLMMRERADRADSSELTWKASSVAIDKMIKSSDAPRGSFIKRALKVFQTWQAIVAINPEVFTHQLASGGPRKFSPVEFIATGVLIDLYMDKRNDIGLSGDIMEMRRYVRAEGRVYDLKTNTTVWKHFWEYIAHIEARRGVTQRPAAGTRPDPPLPPDLYDHGAGGNEQVDLALENRKIPIAELQPEVARKVELLRKKDRAGILPNRTQQRATRQNINTARRTNPSTAQAQAQMQTQVRRPQVVVVKRSPANSPEPHVQSSTRVGQPASGRSNGATQAVAVDSDDDLDEIWVDAEAQPREQGQSSAAPQRAANAIASGAPAQTGSAGQYVVVDDSSDSRALNTNGSGSAATSDIELREEFEKEERFREFKRRREQELAHDPKRARRE